MMRNYYKLIQYTAKNFVPVNIMLRLENKYYSIILLKNELGILYSTGFLVSININRIQRLITKLSSRKQT